jgi:hypothetical protein
VVCEALFTLTIGNPEGEHGLEYERTPCQYTNLMRLMGS